MDYLENFVGAIRGFYSMCLCMTIYLFLPMFRGSEAVFRNILVPLCGLSEQLFLRDLQMLKIEVERNYPEKSRAALFEKAATIFVTRKND